LSQFQTKEADEKDSSDRHCQTPLPPGHEAGSSLDELWVVRDSKRAKNASASSAPSRANAADADLLQKLTHEGPSVGGNQGSSSPGAPASTPRTFMESLQGAFLMRPAGGTLGGLPSQPSKRTADEQIRASRQSRMREQGLTGGSPQGAWRSQDWSDEATPSMAGGKATNIRPGGSVELSRLLGEEAGSSGEGLADGSPSAEQFTLCAARPQNTLFVGYHILLPLNCPAAHQMGSSP
jgi:hypothetical protein